MKSAIVIIMCLLLSACANKNLYERFYKAEDISSAPVQYMPLIKLANDPTNNPRLILTNNMKEQLDIALSENYAFIGQSAFYGPSIEDSLAITFGKTIGAELILLSKTPKDRIAEEVSTVTPILSTTSTKYGSVNSTTLVGSSTTVGVDRLNYHALFAFKNKRPIVFGALLRDLTPDERKAFGSNKGMKVRIVTKGSPAFKADILKDDVLLRVANVEINSQEDYETVLRQHMGIEVTFSINRLGNEVKGTARLNLTDER